MTYKDGLYHKDVYLPAINLVDKNVELSYTYHAIEAAKNDYYGQIELPSKINPALGTIIEAEIKNNKLVKILIRVQYSQKFDLIMAIMFDSGIVKTVWLNAKNDTHKTLDRSKYIGKNA